MRASLGQAGQERRLRIIDLALDTALSLTELAKHCSADGQTDVAEKSKQRAGEALSFAAAQYELVGQISEPERNALKKKFARAHERLTPMVTHKQDV